MLKQKQKQKYTFAVMIILLLVFSFFTKGYTKSTQTFSELDDITQTMEQNDIRVTDWSIYARENVGVLNDQEFKHKFSQLKKIDQKITWKVEETREGWRAVGTRITNAAFKEQFLLLGHPQKQNWHTYIVYKVYGEKWNIENKKQLERNYEDVVKSFFMEEPKKFSCVKGLTNDKMKSVLKKKADELISDFAVEEIESLKEESFLSISAYNGKWKNDIPTKNGAMNLQIAMRQGLGGVTKVTIGTPIITSEY